MATNTPTPEFIKSMIEDLGTHIAPDDDWMPCLHLYKDGHAAIIALLLMEDDKTKDMCAKIMHAMIRRTNPDCVCFISTAWQGAPVDNNQFVDNDAYLEAYREGWIPRPSIDPDRVEIVMALLVSKNLHSVSMRGEIGRSPDKPPKILKWDQIEDDDPGMGRFVEAIVKGFKDADPNGNLDVLAELKQKEDNI